MNLPSNTRLAGSLELSAGIVFIVFNTIAESIYPGYSVRTNALSDLGALGRRITLLWDSQLFLTGLLSLLAIVILFRGTSLNIRGRRLTSVLYMLPPIGTIVVSLFPENSNLVIHTLGAFVNFLFGGIAAIYAYRFTRSPFRYFSGSVEEFGP